MRCVCSDVAKIVPTPDRDEGKLEPRPSASSEPAGRVFVSGLRRNVALGLTHTFILLGERRGTLWFLRNILITMATATELLHKHLALFVCEIPVGEAENVYHEDVTIEFPYAPEGHTRSLSGRDALLAFFARIPGFAKDFCVGEPAITEIEGGLVAEYTGDSTFIESGLPYSQQYVLFMYVRDSKIASMREYYDGQRVLRALGEL